MLKMFSYFYYLIKTLKLIDQKYKHKLKYEYTFLYKYIIEILIKNILLKVIN